MRTRSPTVLVLMVCTGVAKSITSKRLRKRSGKLALLKSTTRLVPTALMSAATLLLGRLTITRPAPSLER